MPTTVQRKKGYDSIWTRGQQLLTRLLLKDTSINTMMTFFLELYFCLYSCILYL